MLRVSELRSGVSKILRVSTGAICTVNWAIIKEFETGEDTRDYVGILITPEILENYGLINDNSTYKPPTEIQEKSNGDIGFSYPAFFFNKRLDKWMDCHTRVCVTYLHQVQNLYFALTSEELSNPTQLS